MPVHITDRIDSLATLLRDDLSRLLHPLYGEFIVKCGPVAGDCTRANVCLFVADTPKVARRAVLKVLAGAFA